MTLGNCAQWQVWIYVEMLSLHGRSLSISDPERALCSVSRPARLGATYL